MEMSTCCKQVSTEGGFCFGEARVWRGAKEIYEHMHTSKDTGVKTLKHCEMVMNDDCGHTRGEVNQEQPR